MDESGHGVAGGVAGGAAGGSCRAVPIPTTAAGGWVGNNYSSLFYHFICYLFI